MLLLWLVPVALFVASFVVVRRSAVVRHGIGVLLRQVGLLIVSGGLEVARYGIGMSVRTGHLEVNDEVEGIDEED